ncbi:MAG: translation elongation factor Ts [Bacteroidales bacterium]
MAEISASDVAKLRKITGAGMMDCKEALHESNGDFDQAIEFLRKKGQKVASKREDREANEGVVISGVSNDRKFGAIVVLNSETDFVAKNQDVIDFTNSILSVALSQKIASIDKLKEAKINGVKISDIILDKIAAIGEKMELSVYLPITAEDVVCYVHPGNRLATVVGFNQHLSDIQIGKDIAMQIAAMSPVSIDKDDCPKEIIEKELEIAKEVLRQEGKAEDMLEKIAMGKLNKFYSESTLLNQEFIKDNKSTVRQYLQSKDKSLTVTTFKRFGLS